MKIRRTIIALLIAILLLGCTQDVDNVTAPAQKATVALSFRVPLTVSTVDVFLFDPDGELTRLGGHSHFDDMDAFSQTTDGDQIVYQLNDDAYIETLSGAKIVYVAFNTPAALVADFVGNETALLSDVVGRAKARSLGGFVMLSDESVFLEKEVVSMLAIEEIETGIESEKIIGIDISITIEDWQKHEIDVDFSW